VELDFSTCRLNGAREACLRCATRVNNCVLVYIRTPNSQDAGSRVPLLCGQSCAKCITLGANEEMIVYFRGRFAEPTLK